MSLPEEARARVEIDEAAVARGTVDSSSVYVEIEGRKPEEIPGILAELEELPPHIEVKDLEEKGLTYLEAANGRLFILTKAMLDKLHKLRRADHTEVGKEDGTSFYEMARQDPDEYLIPALSPAVVAAQEYAERLVRAHRRDFDAHPAETRATWIIETIKRLNKVGKSTEDLGHYLAYAAPGKRVAKQPLENPLRDVRAAILKDVDGMGSIKVGERLGITDDAERMRDKRINQNASNAIRRGREILDRAFGEEGWRAKAERLRAMRLHFEELRLERIEKWETLGPKQQFYALLAEHRITSPEGEERVAKEDGFDKLLGEWMDAVERGDLHLEASIERTDSRFGGVRTMLHHS